MEFSGKVALVTGAGSGLGEATAMRLAADGAKVAVLDLIPDRVSAVVAAISAAGGEAMPLIADVSDTAQMRAAVDAMMQHFGRIDIVVANAGINGVWSSIEDIQPEEWDQTINVNLRGTYLTVHLTVPHLKAVGGGSIIIISSINGTRTFTTPGATAYVAAKSAQAAITQQLAVELGRYHIRVNAVCPGGTRSNISQNTWRRNVEETRMHAVFPEGDIPLTGTVPGEPSDVADAIRFLVSSEARHISGAWLHVDGAQSIVR